LTVRRHGKVEAQLDPTLLTDHCPTYSTPIEEPEEFRAAATFDPSSLPLDLHSDLLKVLAFPDVASKRWVYQQYDQQVQTQTAVVPGAGDAAVLAPRGTSKGIALSLDGNARWTLAHPYRGGLLAVAEAARNVACAGAKPSALTDGLNFGNPQTSRVYWQFDRAVKGIADAAEALGTPVISGNVSFYNESDLGEVPPTPLIGAVGVLDDASQKLSLAPSVPAMLMLLWVPDVDVEQEGLGASAWLSAVHGREEGYPVAPNLAGERRLHSLLVEGATRGTLLSAHDVSDGGLSVTLAEIALGSGLRVEAVLEGAHPFAEVPGLVIVATTDPNEVVELAQRHELEAAEVGRVLTGSGLAIDGVTWSREELFEAYEKTLPRLMER
jgi:phosphoribosylformylglycinamidine (FGAM) synthase-like enzyme